MSFVAPRDEAERVGDALREGQEERAEGYDHKEAGKGGADADRRKDPPPAPGDANPLAKQEGRAYDRREEAL